MPNTIEQAHAMLDQLAAERFFGTVSFQFKDGTVALIRKEETILPASAETKTHNGRTGDRYERSSR
jgi:hypothetical protein